ncbi:MAG: sulfatase-like hydrolase/transferase [Bradymonadales bacterium]|nr:sulfatase-like hydrolase/transferase [Bradymonadales bacterium]
MQTPSENQITSQEILAVASDSIFTKTTEEDLQGYIRSRTPWHARGLVAGLLAGLLLALIELVRLKTQSNPPLHGATSSLHYLATCWTVYGFVTVPLGLGFGLSLVGWVRWLTLPGSWRRLRDDKNYRSRWERQWAAAAVLFPLIAAATAAVAFLVQRTFVRNMNNPTMGAAFLGLVVVFALMALLWFVPLGMTVLSAVLPRIGLHRLCRREPRLLRATLALVVLACLVVVAALFARFYNPTVWSPAWIAFLLATALLPLLLTLSGPLIRWAGAIRHPALCLAVLAGYLAMTGWTFTQLDDWEEPSQALLVDSVFAPTASGLIHRLTDRDGDGQSALLAGGDCDDSDPNVYSGAVEIPGDGIDNNCLGGDAPLQLDTNPDPAETEAHDPASIETGERTSIESQGATGVANNGSNANPPAGEDRNGVRAGSGVGADPAVAPEPGDPTGGAGANHGSSAGVETIALAGDQSRPDIIIIMVDALRPDHLGFFGYERDISPQMDEFAHQSVVFERAYAQAPHTPRSIPSIFTSRPPSRINFRNPGFNYPVVRDSNLSVFEVLQQLGYYTLGLASHYYFEPRRGMDQGFDLFDNRGSLSIAETNEVITAPQIFEHLEEHIDDLRALERPFCLFIHYYEPHGSWLPHPEVVDFGRATGRQRHINNYDSEIAFVDIWVGRTFDLLRENGWYDDSILVLLSDHGEAFNEHGRYFHGQSLYEEELRVVLFLKIPGHQPTRVTTPVRLIDLAPTLVTLAGGQPPDEFMGRPLFPDPQSLPQVDIVSELLPYSNFQQHFVSLIRGDTKIIYDVTRRRYELYDLAADPGETENLYRTSDQADALRQALTGWLER